MDRELREPSNRRIFLKQVAAVVGATPLAGATASIASAAQAGEGEASAGEPFSTAWLFFNAD